MTIRMKATVAIPTLGRTFFAYNMVLALHAGTRMPDEILVVDQTRPQDRNPFAWSGLRKLSESGLCRILELPQRGLTLARNAALQASDADLFIFVDDDGFIPEDFVESYLELFADPQVGAATGMILTAESDYGTIDTNCIHTSLHNGHTMLRGGNFAVRREIVFAVGGLDERFVGAGNYEDADLAWRLHNYGARVIWAPRPWLYHLNHRSGGGRAVSADSYRNFAYNLCYFYFRHHRTIDWAAWRRLLRWRVFNGESFCRPWMLPRSATAFLQGYWHARRAASDGPRLPLLNHAAPGSASGDTASLGLTMGKSS
jgi:glycosyltransferase involved in cell wall biosynthesis